MPAGDISARTIQIAGDGGEQIDAYLAEPAGEGPFPGIAIIHHFPGWDQQTQEIARTFAVHGYRALCPNLYHRETVEIRREITAGSAGDPLSVDDELALAATLVDVSASRVRDSGGAPDSRIVGDIGGAISHLRAGPTASGKVGVIGYCSGGRHAVLVGCSLDVDAVIDCYGAAVLNPMPEGAPLKLNPIPEVLGNLSGPMLGLFGAEDQYPAPDEVVELDRILTEHGKQHEFRTFDAAGHAFFAVNRPNFRPQAAAEGWAVLWEWLHRTIG